MCSGVVGEVQVVRVVENPVRAAAEMTAALDQRPVAIEKHGWAQALLAVLYCEHASTSLRDVLRVGRLCQWYELSSGRSAGQGAAVSFPR